MTTHQRQTYAEDAKSVVEWPADTTEWFAGYAVLGMPFSSGHYLAFGDYPASSIGPGYPPHLCCARYFESALSAAVTAKIAVSWNSRPSATIRIPAVLDWRIELASSRTPSAVSALALRIPAQLWTYERMLRTMEMIVGPLLPAGTMWFSAVVRNGRSFRARPLSVWIVQSACASIDGTDAGRPGPLARQNTAAISGFRSAARSSRTVASSTATDSTVAVQPPDFKAEKRTS
ncbi:hypothetical protein [Arthrobacter sp. H14-L1]|uniref:hypothetical protein n=1 Tax=Arthrobacter sp. H14-L1 TaxID=2996697 RepID=UPI00226DE820|nr:hypothetical protein [Arthrobacter sp. H14-L1]MCY0906029.1 hypothetical protein [Arthrobacter sp. H14-L1]